MAPASSASSRRRGSNSIARPSPRTRASPGCAGSGEAQEPLVAILLATRVHAGCLGIGAARVAHAVRAVADRRAAPAVPRGVVADVAHVEVLLVVLGRVAIGLAEV